MLLASDLANDDDDDVLLVDEALVVEEVEFVGLRLDRLPAATPAPDGPPANDFVNEFNFELDHRLPAKIIINLNTFRIKKKEKTTQERELEILNN